jgi:hypothetical protein
VKRVEGRYRIDHRVDLEFDPFSSQTVCQYPGNLWVFTVQFLGAALQDSHLDPHHLGKLKANVPLPLELIVMAAINMG